VSDTRSEVVLRDVPGPSALGGGVRRSIDLLWMISVTDFKKSYFGTALGYLWSIARPLMLFGVLLAVFTLVFHFGKGVPHYPELLLMNIVVFGFFQEATVLAVGSIVGQESIVRKTQFPRLVIPLSVVLTSFFNLALNLVVVLIFMLAAGVTPLWTWLLFPILLVLLIVFTTAVAMIVASLYPRFRDISILWTVCSTVLFYGTPILYTVSAVQNTLMRHIILLNPLAPIFELLRKWMIEPGAPTPAASAGGGLRLLAPIAIYVVVCGLAVWIFNREAPRIAERL
jgi:ABC-2 type transport system permease protein